MEGSIDSAVDGYSLLYQLILVQTIYEMKQDFTKVPWIINEHPLLESTHYAKIDKEKAKNLFVRLLKNYDIPYEESEISKVGISQSLDQLVNLLYAKYSQQLINQVEGDKNEFKDILKTFS